jgi:4-hydroxybenzoate polyprenyltransferase
MVGINDHWKLITAIYIIGYLTIASVIFLITKRGNPIVILVIGLVVILPYILYNLFKKKQNPIYFDEENIETLY